MKVLSLFDGISCGRLALERAGIEVTEYYAAEIDKFAVQCASHHWKDTIHIGSVTEISFKNGILKTLDSEYDVGSFDLIIGGSPCFVSGTKVLTEDGYSNIENIKVGTRVLTHTASWKEVLEIGSKVSETFQIKAQGMLPTTTTYEHPYYTSTMSRTKGKRVLSEPIWKKAGELKKKDFIAIPIIKDTANIYDLTDDECYVLGRYIADERSTGFSSKRLLEIAEKECGIGAVNKYISPTLLKLPTSKLKILLDGLLDGDGCLVKDIYKLTSVSQTLVQSLTLAVAKVYGTVVNLVFTKKDPTCIIEGRVVNQKDIYTASFCKTIKKQSNYFTTEDYIWVPVKSVSKTEVKELVFNLEVEGDNTYTANNIVVHNCQSFSLAGDGSGFDGASGLYYEYIRILREVNPTYFLLENVVMKKEWQNVIDTDMGVTPIMINSNLLSAQNRKRLYWTNIEGIDQPKDLGIVLCDVLEKDVADSLYLSDKAIDYMSRLRNGKPRWDFHKNPLDGKASCLTANMFKGVPYGVLNVSRPRRLSPVECERLQTLPDGYTSMLSNTQRYKSIGNGWTVDVVAHIFKNLNKEP